MTAKRTKRPPHRPTVFTAELAKRLSDRIATGDTISTAARRCGIDASTFYDWVARGEASESPYSEFPKLVQTAKKRRLNALEERVVAASRKDWKAAMALLRVLNPNRFSEHLRISLVEAIDGIMDDLRREFGAEEALFTRILVAISGRRDLGLEQGVAPRLPTERPWLPESDRG